MSHTKKYSTRTDLQQGEVKMLKNRIKKLEEIAAIKKEPYIVKMPIFNTGDAQMYQVNGEDYSEQEFIKAGYTMNNCIDIH